MGFGGSSSPFEESERGYQRQASQRLGPEP